MYILKYLRDGYSCMFFMSPWACWASATLIGGCLHHQFVMRAAAGRKAAGRKAAGVMWRKDSVTAEREADMMCVNGGNEMKAFGPRQTACTGSNQNGYG